MKDEKQNDKSKNMGGSKKSNGESDKIKKPEFGKFMNSGIKGFDKLFTRGIPRNSSIIVEGGPGSGKTIFCLQTAMNACERGETVLYMSFEEHKDRLIDHMEDFGWNPKKYIEKGLLRIERYSALDVARSVEALLSAAKKELMVDIQPVLFPKDFEPDLLLIDSLTSISSAFSGEESRFRIYMEQLFRYLENERITSLLIRESPMPTHLGSGTSQSAGGEAVSFLSDGIIVIYNVVFDNGTRGGGIEVLKMRGESFDKRIVEMEITTKGMVVHDKSLAQAHKINYRLT